MSAESLASSMRVDVRMRETYIYAGLFAAAVGAFCLAQLIGHRLGLASDLVAVAGDATCGWSWLLVRALFQPPDARRTPWPLFLVLFLVAAGAFLRLSGDSDAAALPRMVENLSGLVSSGLLLLAAVEPLRGLRAGLPRAERRFRIGFALGYVGLLAVAVVWVNGAPAESWAAQWKLAVKAGCAVLAVVGMGLAVWLRRGHPLVEVGRARRRARTDDDGLGERLLRLMTDEAIYTRHSLKVADLARRLGEAEYKVTQSITGPLGFRNFNHMANHFRIEEAKRRLADPAFDALPILTIAYDCGFGSIGPFNRAFKAQTGVTPNAYRRDLASSQRRGSADPARWPASVRRAA